jgi:hypothetical protein
MSALFSGHLNIRYCIDTELKYPFGYCKIDTSLCKNDEFWANQNPPQQSDTSECIKLLIELAEVCQEYNTRLIVFTPPFPDDYIAEMTNDGRANLQQIIYSVYKKYPIEYHDYTDDKNFRDPSLFLYWNHLNHKGATLFAQRIKEDFNL